MKMKNNYNPDVLSCLANLSSDEVFTPPKLANKILDLIPEEIWKDKNATFLNPACKSGVFLREIAKRLIEGLEYEIPDLQKRIDHIYKNQLFGIGITEITSLLSRRSLYCSKKANGKYSVSKSFKNNEGNIFFEITDHDWKSNKCIYCGASKSEYGREEELETHAYQFIHNNNPNIIKNMKFDVIIGNPPYQLSTKGGAAQAKPLYHIFIEKAKKLRPRYISMIIPARWFAGGIGLDNFRNVMLSDRHIRKIVYHSNAKDCFPSSSIGGGVIYFLWDRETKGLCEYTNIHNGSTQTALRKLDEFPIFIRFNNARSIINKVIKNNFSSLSEIVSSLSPFGINSSTYGKKKRFGKDECKLFSSNGVGYFAEKDIAKGKKYVDKYKVMVSKVTSEHAGEPDRSGRFRVLSKIKTLKPKEICTFSYFVIGPFNSLTKASNLRDYLKTNFVRFLLLQAISSINISKTKFCFVPMQDFNKSWTDRKLYKKYKLTKEEIKFIESMIRPMQ